MINLKYLWNARPSVVDMVPTVQVGSSGYLTPVVGAKRATYLFVAYPVMVGIPPTFSTPFEQPTSGGYTTNQPSPNGDVWSRQTTGQSSPTYIGVATSIGINPVRYLTVTSGKPNPGYLYPLE
jgi:hypothetical protein